MAELPDIEFLKVDAEEIEIGLLNNYKGLTGRSLSVGDPVRLFIKFIANELTLLKNELNEMAKQNLLKYAVGEKLDNLAALWAVERIPAQKSSCIMKVELEEVRNQNVGLSKGLRISTDDKVYFELAEDVIVEAGEKTATVQGNCMTEGEKGNGYLPSEIHKIIDPVSYVKKIENITITAGGSEVETDEEFRERIYESPERLSIAGPSEAYKWQVKSLNSSIVDVAVDSPSPGKVRIVPLMKNGEIPSETMRQEILEAISDEKVRPLTDFVYVENPIVRNYKIDIDYWLDEEVGLSEAREKVEKAIEEFESWTKEKLGRDINDSELIRRVKAINGVKRLKVNNPSFTMLTNQEVAICTGKRINYEGREGE